MSKSVIIPITEDIRIAGAGVDWCVESRHVAEKSGKERWDMEGSYASPLLAVLSLVNGRNTGLLVRQPGDADDLVLTLAAFVERLERASRNASAVVKRALVARA